MRLICLAAMLVMVAPAAAAQSMLSGQARAADGDSLSISGLSIRLHGIDAPELDQTCDRAGTAWKCGEEAKRQLQALLDGQHIHCRRVDTDDFGRMVAVCQAGSWELNKAMVEAGWAVAFRQYSDSYVADEYRAKTARLGIWNSTFETPADYRRRRETRRTLITPPLPVARSSTSRPQSAYLIKGNHSRKGEWIYHLPGMPYYAQTRPEAMFCTEAEAQAAGYRRSRAQH